MTTIAHAWDDPARPWPSIVYVEPGNICDFDCVCCLNSRVQKPRGMMTLDTFKQIAEKIKEKGRILGAMFCFGEPLLDPTFTEKCRYANEIGVMMPGIGFNTNSTHLTPEKFQGILDYTPNITLSFFNTGEEFNRLTRSSSWDISYRNALDFIAYRDKHKPSYRILIGVNKITGHSIENVKKAFAGKNVGWIHDVELLWGGLVITGPLNRLIEFPEWRCDGHKGAVQVKWNGNVEMCAYDICGTPTGGETLFGNILTDSWEQLEVQFRAKWREGTTLCRRCDYFNWAASVLANGTKRPEPRPDDWFDWQIPYFGSKDQVRE